MAIPLEFCEVWFAFNLDGDNETMYTHLAYGVDSAIIQSAVDAGFAEFIDVFRPLYSSDVTLAGGHILQQTAAGIRRWETGATPLAGSGLFQLAPNNCAYLAKKVSPLGGRRNRGRMFFPSPSEPSLDAAGNVIGTAITDWNDALAELLPGGSIHTAFGFLGLAVILHETGSQTPTECSNLVLASKAATQRRRMRP